MLHYDFTLNVAAARIYATVTKFELAAVKMQFGINAICTCDFYKLTFFSAK